MKAGQLFLLLSLVSLLIMLVVDYIVGAQAEFLNAYSVLQRLLGQTPSAGDSLVATKWGAWGELLVVLAVNLAIGGVLTALVLFFRRS